MKFYSLASAATLAGSAYATTLDTCFSNNFNDAGYKLWVEATQARNIETMNPCYGYAAYGLSTRDVGLAVDQFADQEIVSLVDPSADNLVPVADAIAEFAEAELNTILDNQYGRDLLQVYVNMERRAFNLFNRVLQDYVRAIATGEGIYWNDDYVDREEFIYGGYFSFKALINSVTPQYVRNVAIDLVEVVEPFFDMISFLLNNPDYLEPAVNDVLHYAGNLSQRISQWGEIQSEVNEEIFENFGMAMFGYSLEKTALKENFEAVGLASEIGMAGLKAWKDSMMDGRIERRLGMLGMQCIAETNPPVKKFLEWVDFFEGEPEYNDYDYGVSSRKRRSGSMFPTVFNDEVDGGIFYLLSEAYNLVSDPEALENYEFKISDVYNLLSDLATEEELDQVFNHFSTVNTLPDLAKRFIRSDPVKKFTRVAVNLVQDKVNDTPFALPDIAAIEAKFGLDDEADWSNNLYTALRNFGEGVMAVRNCEEYCQNKFY